MIKETTAMTNELSNLQQQIQEALQLLQESKVFAPEQQCDASGALPATDVFFAEHNSLLDKCAQVCAQYQKQKPTIRIIHHVACSGGTLISKCLSVMPNTHLLSEVHPHSKLHINKTNPPYMPSDLASLSSYARIPNIEKLHDNLFIQGVSIIHDHVESLGGRLVLRDHSHTDFHTGHTINGSPSVIDILSETFNIKSIITFRDPIDSYLSLKENNWIQFTPKSFEEYCARIIKMLNIYEKVPLFHYESFIESPSTALIEMCKSLSIDYDDSWELFFDLAQITGDSGRSGNKISRRPRRDIDERFHQEILESDSYQKIKSRFNYLEI